MSYKTKIKHAVSKFTQTSETRNLIQDCEIFLECLKDSYAINLEKCAPQLKQMDNIQKTFKSLCRTHGHVSAVILAEIVTMLSMLTVQQFNEDLWHNLGLYVWPAALVGAFYIGFGMDKIEKKADLLSQQMKDLDNLKTR